MILVAMTRTMWRGTARAETLHAAIRRLLLAGSQTHRLELGELSSQFVLLGAMTKKSSMELRFQKRVRKARVKAKVSKLARYRKGKGNGRGTTKRRVRGESGGA